MNKLKELFDRLSLPPDASKADIKKAYYKEAKTIHPDLGGDNKRFNDLNEAYTILMDDDKRSAYVSGLPLGFDLEHEAENLLMTLFNKCIDQNLRPKFKEMLIVESIEDQINIACGKLEEEISGLKNILSSLKNMRDKVDCDLDTNLYIILLNKKESDTNTKIKMVEKTLDITKKAYDIIKHYYDKVQEKPQEIGFSGPFSSYAQHFQF